MDAEIAALLGRFFAEDEWPAVYDSDGECFVVRFKGTQAEWTCLAYPLEEDQQAVFYSIAPLHADEAHLTTAAEYITRANFGLVLGNFELDYEDGEIRYKTSIDLEGAELSPALIRHIVHANIQAMDRYLPGLMLVLVDGASPAEAVARAEGE